MIRIFYQIPVKAPKEIVWKILVDKIEQPEKYISGIASTKFTTTEDGDMLRVMQRDGIVVKEIIQKDKEQFLTYFELKDHPQYKGNIENRVFEANGKTFLTYTIEWEAHTGEEDFERINEWFEKAVLSTKKAAEELVLSN